ncbi:MAG TPA: DNA methyltransferase [Polyangiaceae bacterium]|nr:DNA methyltransferase [Polyangiaceae bacterium]
MNAVLQKRAALSPAVTFRGNLRSTRHGWLRLTPAYSVQLVRELLEQRSLPNLPVLDPFCGTGTTLVACAEQGIACRTVDINPFLCWLAEAKSRSYSAAELTKAEQLVERMARVASKGRGRGWVPALHRIEKWWDEATLSALSRAFAELQGKRGKARDLAALAFCRTLIDVGHVSFRHQSMSFRKRAGGADVGAVLRAAFAALRGAAAQPLTGADAQALVGDARQLTTLLPKNSCGSVITSPPYCNRMSYIRELRPYMYWLGFLDDGRQAGELDWQAIGGTWGSATSQLMTWEPERRLELPKVRNLMRRIAEHSPVLARYVERYFTDMDRHVGGVAHVVARGAELHYVIGNSKFFDVVVPAQTLLSDLFARHGFVGARTRVLRRRTSKKELFEYLVSARRS